MNPDSERTNRLGELVEAIDPVERSILRTARIENALDEIGTAITSRPRRRVRPSAVGCLLRRPRYLIAVGLAVVAVGSALAADAVLSAHTGRYPTKAEVPMGGPGEALNPAASDFRAVALDVASDIPYPDGYESWRSFLISDEIRMDAGDGGLVSTGALHGWFAASAFCSWVHAWRQADIAGDSSAASRAAQMVAAAPTWKAVTDEDPDPDPSVLGDGGSTQFTLFGWMLPYRSAVLAHDRARVEELLGSGYGDKCWTSDPDWRAQLAAHPEWGSLSRAELAREYRLFLAGARS